MKRIPVWLFVLLAVIACKDPKPSGTSEGSSQRIAELFDRYYEEGLLFFPFNATAVGDARYNDLLRISFTDGFTDSLKHFYSGFLQQARSFDREKLDPKEQIQYDVFLYELQTNLEGLSFNDDYIPFNQFYGLPLTMGQWGSGSGSQPFATVKDYDDWLKRCVTFSAWADSAIVYFRKGFDQQYVLPKSIVVKMIPQLRAFATDDVTKSLFYTPITKLSDSSNHFKAADKERLTQAYTAVIKSQLLPAYKRLGDFLSDTYLIKARTSSGIGSLPGGAKFYEYLVRRETTTGKTPEEIYQTGLKEVARIRSLMDSVKSLTGFTGDLDAFFNYLQTDPTFKPYKTPQEVLAAFERIHQTMIPSLKKMFNKVPKTPFEIRQTEAFRAESASAEYFAGSADGTRPGIFYVPILDATQFNITGGMESLFLHEAIPGHHYQISLQQEDTLLPKFIRYGGNNAYAEGWALYCESLGKELGLYTDPYQYMGALGDEMHRAIRLVVDVAIHSKGMSREEAIKYMMRNEAIPLQGATAEVERYMVIPGQALSYKIGALKIKELREKYERQLGSRFNLAEFHDQVLGDGPLPLAVLEKKMDEWANKLVK